MVKVKDVRQDYDKALEAFESGVVKKFKNYFSLENALVHKTIQTSNNKKEQEIITTIIAVKNKDGLIIGNANALLYIGRKSAFGNVDFDYNIKPVQKLIKAKYRLLPFDVFIKNKIDLTKLEVIEQGNTNIYNVIDYSFNKYGNYSHGNNNLINKSFAPIFFKINENRYYFDVDKEKIKENQFTPFIIQVSDEVKTINEAELYTFWQKKVLPAKIDNIFEVNGNNYY